MCLSPVRIKNNKINFDLGTDSIYNYVPCNHCPECLTNRRNDILIRALAESEYFYTRDSDKNLVLHKTKKMFFLTLTYDNEHKHERVFPDGSKRMVFSRRDIQLFFKLFNKRLSKFNCFMHKLCACEYGSDNWYLSDSGQWRKATHRPHYHILLFLSEDIPSTTLQALTMECWQKCDWSKVRYPFGRSGDGSVSSQGAVRYVTKYVTKYEGSLKCFETWLHNLHEDEVVDSFVNHWKRSNSHFECSLFDKTLVSDDIARTRAYIRTLFEINSIKSAFPFFQASMYFGHALDKCKYIKVDWDKLKVSHFDFNKNDFVQRSLPMYYRKKLYYSHDLSPVLCDGVQETSMRPKFHDSLESFYWQYSPKFHIKSSFTDKYVDLLGKNIFTVFNDTMYFYKGLQEIILSFKKNNNFAKFHDFTSDDWDIIECFNRFDDLSFYILFNRGRDVRTYIPRFVNLTDAFRIRYIDKDTSCYYNNFPDLCEELEMFLQIAYNFQRVIGLLRDEKFKLDRLLQHRLKKYLLNYKFYVSHS